MPEHFTLTTTVKLGNTRHDPMVMADFEQKIKAVADTNMLFTHGVAHLGGGVITCSVTYACSPGEQLFEDLLEFTKILAQIDDAMGWTPIVVGGTEKEMSVSEALLVYGGDGASITDIAVAKHMQDGDSPTALPAHLIGAGSTVFDMPVGFFPTATNLGLDGGSESHADPHPKPGSGNPTTVGTPLQQRVAAAA